MADNGETAETDNGQADEVVDGQPDETDSGQVDDVDDDQSAQTEGGEPDEQTVDEGALEQDIVIRALDVKRYYGEGEEATKALDGITLNVYRGEYLSIMGPSGSGKSTLFNMIGGIDAPTEGMVFIDEIDVAQLDSYELAWMRCHKIGYIFQSYNILPVLTALENVTLPMLFAGLTPDEARDKGRDILTRVGLGERIFHRPYELSGGQQQRVAVARAIANDPVIVLADEPTANLDIHTGKEMIDLLRQLKEEDNVTVISATHDMKMLDVSDRILWIRDGQVLRLEERKNINIKVGRIGEEVG